MYSYGEEATVRMSSYDASVFDRHKPAFRTNPVAAIAWILGFFLGWSGIGTLAATVLAIIALTRAEKADQNNRDLAIGALISVFAWIMFFTLILMNR